MTHDTAGAPLVLTRDRALTEELMRLAAAAGVRPELFDDPAASRRHWSSAPVVLVGADLAAQLAEQSPPRRAAVYLIGLGEVPDELFRVALTLGAEHVATLPRSDGWLVELLTDLGEGEVRSGTVIGVIGGSGGAGATTFAAALASVAARRSPSLAVDADALGPGLDRVLGLEAHDGIRWDSLQQTTGRLSARSLREAVPRRDGVGVLTWPAAGGTGLAPFAVREALSAARRGHDLVAVDLPRSIDAVAEEVIARCDHVLVVTVPTVTGLTAAARVCARLDISTLAHVVRGTISDPATVTRVTGWPVLAAMRDQRGLAEAIDLGTGPVRGGRGVLARTARDVLARIGPGQATS